MFAIQIDKRKNIPYYQQIVDSIKDNIKQGLVDDQTPLPTIKEISEYYQISDIVIRKAYRELEKLKLLKTVKGKGAFIQSRPHIVIPIDKLFDYQRMLFNQYGTFTRSINFVDVIDEHTHIIMCTFVNHYPVSFEQIDIHVPLYQEIQNDDYLLTTLLKILNVDHIKTESTMYTKNASLIEARFLDIKIDDPLFHVKTTCLSQSRKILFEVISIFPAEYVIFEANIS